jgi:hypothetical protein
MDKGLQTMKPSAYRLVVKTRLFSSLAVFLGLLCFAAITGGRILRPQHLDWLLQADPATNFIGWHFFRHAPMWQLPLGANPDYGMEIGSSIVFTDSIPLLAFLFKPFDALLPETFQYFGLWIAVCFALQALFAYKLLARFTHEKWLPLIAAAFFVIAPVFLWRLHGHYALFAQWVLLAGLYLYFAPRFSLMRWITLLGVTALIHAYLLVMVAALWSADLVQRWLRKEVNAPQVAAYAVISLSVTAAIMWLAGYFMIDDGLNQVGIGVYRLNLLSLFDPDNIWSRLLRDREQTSGDYEGFNFVGVGILTLALIAFYEFLRKPRIRFDSTVVAPLLFVCICLTVFAISNRIAIGRHELLAYSIPSSLQDAAGAFRASGRMFWPVYYMIYLAVFVFLFRRLESRIVIAACTTMLALQVADSSLALQHFRTKFRQPPAWESPMVSPVWKDIASHYRKIVFVLPHNQPKDYLPLAYFAAMNRMPINIGYFARVSRSRERSAREQLASQVLSNKLSPDSLYVFEDDALWQAALHQAGSSDVSGIVDGFRIVAPRLKDCVPCDRAAIEKVVGAIKLAPSGP